MIAAPFEKTYLSRAQSRIWSMDNPVGDPFGGPSYGERREPVSMIAAVVPIGVGASAVGAAVTAGALTLSAVMGGLMIAGGAASLIGTVSGNKKLAMIGGIVAGVGGLGSGAANLFADSAASAAGSLSEVASANAEGMSAMTQAGMSFDQQASVFSQIQSGNTAGAMDALTKAGLSFDQQAAIFNGAAQSAAFDPSTIMQPATTVAPDTASNGLIKNALDTSGAGEVANISTTDQLANELGNQINLASETTLQPSPYEALADASGKTSLVPKATPGADMSPYLNDPNYLEALNGTSTINPANASGVDLTKYANDPNYIEALTGTPTANPANAAGVDLSKYANDPNYIEALTGKQPAAQTSWLDKIEGIAKGIEKYKTTANMGGNLIQGAMKYAIPSQSDQAAIELLQARANLANQEASAIAALEERKRRQNEAVKNLKPIQLNNASNPIFGNALNGAGIINSARA